MIFTFGDSHCQAGWGQLPKGFGIPIRMVHTGPHLMFTFGKQGLDLLDIKKFGVAEGDSVVFCFGEIDVRCHFYDYRRWGIRHLVEELVEQYMIAIKQNVSTYQSLDIFVYFVPPAVRKGSVINNPRYPYVGSDDERRLYSEQMNVGLCDWCGEVGFTFIDLYASYCKDGFLNEEMSDGGPHIKVVDPLLNFVRQKMLHA